MHKAVLFSLFLLSGSAFAADLTGDYTGTSATDDGDHTAKIHLVIKKNADAWDCKFTFNMDGDDVATKTVSCAVDGPKMNAEYIAEVEGTPMHILIEGKAKDDKSLEGTFKTVGTSDADATSSGTWKASPQP